MVTITGILQSSLRVKERAELRRECERVKHKIGGIKKWKKSLEPT